MLQNRIRKLLLKAGIDPSLSGYDFLLTGIEMCYLDRTMLQSVTKALYIDIGKPYGIKPSNIERCMRHAIDKAKKNDCEFFQKEFAGFIDNENKLSNSQFIGLCVEILKLQEEIENVKQYSDSWQTDR